MSHFLECFLSFLFLLFLFHSLVSSRVLYLSCVPHLLLHYNNNHDNNNKSVRKSKSVTYRWQARHYSRMDKSLICNFFPDLCLALLTFLSNDIQLFSVSSLFSLQKIVGKLIFMFVSLYRVIVGMHFRQNVSYNEIILVLFYASHPTLIYFNSKIYYNNVIKLTNKIHIHRRLWWPRWRT